MTDFSPAVADYLQTRRAMGYKLAEDGRLLHQFAAYLDSVHAEHLRLVDALSWATAAPRRGADMARRSARHRAKLRQISQRFGSCD